LVPYSVSLFLDTTQGRYMKHLPALLVALGLIAAVPAAHASMVVQSRLTPGPDVMMNDAEFVSGNSATSVELDLRTAGTLTLNFKDLDFTGALTSLEFGLSETSASMSGMVNADSLTIDLTLPTKLYLDVFARAGQRTGFGLYNLYAFFQAAPSPVPLPASWLGLACGFAGLFWVIRRPRQTKAVPRQTTVTDPVV
jgi:hypothetical protein